VQAESSGAIEVRGAELTVFWAFDLAAFTTTNEELLRLARADRGWLEELREAIHQAAPTQRLAPIQAQVDEAAYKRTNERVGASTLSALEARRELPLRIPAAREVWREGGDFEWSLVSVAIGTLGAASIKYQARIDRSMRVEQMIFSYHLLVQLLRADLPEVVAELFHVLNRTAGPIEGVEFTAPAPSDLERLLAAYECLDVDLALLSASGAEPVGMIPIKTLIRDGDEPSLRELAALSRMTLTEPEHYDQRRLEGFQDADIGNREDELWLVNANRMLRYNPDRHLERVIWFYTDVQCLSEMLTQQLAALEYTEAWLRDARARLRESLARTTNILQEKNDLGAVLASIESVTDLIANPASVLIGIRHPFFRTVAERLVRELRLDVIGERLSQSTKLFLDVTTSVFFYDVRTSSRVIELQQVRATTTMRRLAWVTAVATISALVVATVALVRGSDASSRRSPGRQPTPQLTTTKAR
jgi:hypothetical protein